MGKTGPTVTLNNDNCEIKISDYSWSLVPFQLGVQSKLLGISVKNIVVRA